MLSETQTATLSWLANERTGRSSETMAFWLAFGIRKEDSGYPHDPSDLDKCLKLLSMAPQLRPELHKMKEISPEWSSIVDMWDEIEAMHLDEVGLDGAKGRSLPSRGTYDLLKKAHKIAEERTKTAETP